MTQGRYTRSLGDQFQFLNCQHMTNPDTFLRQNLPRFGLSSVAIAATGIMTSARIHLVAGDVVTNIGFTVGGTAGASMTAWWVALYSDAATPALLAQSADQTSGALAANTNYEIALATAQTIPRTGIYRVALAVTASTIPTLLGTPVPKARTGELALAHSSGSAVGATAPATIATPTELAVVPRFIVS